METSNHRQVMSSAVENRQPCNDGCSHYDKSNHSRRSIDWRDSGIVIDEDNQLFHSFDNICNLDTQSSIWSDCVQRDGEQAARHISGASTQKLVLEQDDDGDTILHLAVVGFTLNRVKDLINVCDLNAINNMMQTPMHVAILANRPEMVQILVEANVRLDIHDRRGNTPLHLACQKGLPIIVDIILGAVTSDVDSALSQTLETCNFDGLTCLHLAAINNHKDIVKLLVDKYCAQTTARDSKSGETILHMAIRQFNVELVGFLLGLGEHFNVTDYSGRDPLATIAILQDSCRTDQTQRNKLAKIKHLIDLKINECVGRGGCCVTRQIKQNGSLDVSTDLSSSSSDYSDSDHETN